MPANKKVSPVYEGIKFIKKLVQSWAYRKHFNNAGTQDIVIFTNSEEEAKKLFNKEEK